MACAASPEGRFIVSFHVLQTKGGRQTVLMGTLGVTLIIMISDLLRLILTVFTRRVVREVKKKSVHFCSYFPLCFVSFVICYCGVHFISCLSHTFIHILSRLSSTYLPR